MFMECDEVAVLGEVWALAKARNVEAIERLRGELNGMELYVHGLSADSPPYVWVSIRDLYEVGVVKLVILQTV